MHIFTMHRSKSSARVYVKFIKVMAPIREDKGQKGLRLTVGFSLPLIFQVLNI